MTLRSLFSFRKFVMGSVALSRVAAMMIPAAAVSGGQASDAWANVRREMEAVEEATTLAAFRAWMDQDLSSLPLRDAMEQSYALTSRDLWPVVDSYWAERLAQGGTTEDVSLYLAVREDLPQPAPHQPQGAVGAAGDMTVWLAASTRSYDTDGNAGVGLGNGGGNGTSNEGGGVGPSITPPAGPPESPPGGPPTTPPGRNT